MTTTGTPSASTITVAGTLDLLERDHAAVADGIANGRYVIWLGSGISRGRVAGVRGLVRKVLEFLQEQARREGPGSPHRAALERAIAKAGLRPDEGSRMEVDVDADVATWRDLEVVLDGLADRYSEFLDIRVSGQDEDYLLWDAVDVVATYGRSVSPDVEHLALAVLAREGVVADAPSGNWDGLVEAAVTELTCGYPGTLQVVVLPSDLQAPRGMLRVIKFHGCAVRAADDPATYRAALIARASQIDDWPQDQAYAAIRGELVSLATSKRTLMIGLSAQDPNIRAVFTEAKLRTPWSWPVDPPAYVFAGDQLGDNHERLLKDVYSDDYAGNEASIERAALIRAYGAQLLTALVLYVLAAKLRALLRLGTGLALDPSTLDALDDGIRTLRDRVAAAADGDGVAFVRALAAEQTRTLTLFRSGTEPPAGGAPYAPITSCPVDRISLEPNIEAGGLPELAAGAALIGRGMAAGTWHADVRPTASGRTGSVRIVSPDGRETAVFFAANRRTAVELVGAGLVPDYADDVVVLHSTEPAERLARAPHARLGRVGHGGPRHVNVAGLLHDAEDAQALDNEFRKAAAL